MDLFKYAFMFVIMYGCASTVHPKTYEDHRAEYIQRFDSLNVCLSMSIDYRYHKRICDDLNDEDRYQTINSAHCDFVEHFEKHCLYNP